MKKLHALLLTAVIMLSAGCATWERLDGGQIFDDLIRSVVSASTSVLVSKIAGLESTEGDTAVAELHYAYVRGFYDPEEIKERFVISSHIAMNALAEYQGLLEEKNEKATKSGFLQVIQGVKDVVAE